MSAGFDFYQRLRTIQGEAFSLRWEALDIAFSPKEKVDILAKVAEMQRQLNELQTNVQGAQALEAVDNQKLGEQSIDNVIDGLVEVKQRGVRK